MARTPGVSSLTVSRMVWPGTHDSGANSYSALDRHLRVPASRLTAGLSWQWYAMSKFTNPIFGSISASKVKQVLGDVTITQPGQSIYDQLKNGARYLDLRVARSSKSADKTFYLVHTFAVGLLSDALEGILRFMNEHRGEVVIIKVQPKFMINTKAEVLQLMNYVTTFTSSSGLKIRNFAFVKKTSRGSDFSQCGTIGDLVSSNRRLLLTFDSYDKAPLSENTWFFFQRAFLKDRWTPASTTKTKHKTLLADILHKHALPKIGRVFNVQFILTPYASKPSASKFLQAGLPTLKQLAAKMNPTLESFVFGTMNKSVRSFTNIYTFDLAFEYRYEINAIMRRLIAERLPNAMTSALSSGVPVTTHTVTHGIPLALALSNIALMFNIAGLA